MVDKDTINQVLGGLMLNPIYLSETDKYNLSITDFSTLFDKYVFSAIYNLYKDGAKKISPVDIDTYFNAHPEAKSTFEKNNGINFLQDILDFVIPENFPFYYKRLKKFNILKDLKKSGFDISDLYEENLINPKAKEINDAFEEMEINDIFLNLKKKLMTVESNYATGDATETTTAAEGITDLIRDLSRRPEVGAPLQGNIFNTITRGARKTKFYIRSAGSGVGKSRRAVGDACYLSYPVRFNTEKWEWEWCGSNEKTLFIATEQEKEEIQTLILAYLTGFNEEKILFANYSELEKEVVLQAEKVMKHFNNLYIVRLGNPNIEQVKAVVRQNWITNDIQNVFYDYIFSSPSLLNEFRDLRVREDVALGLLSTALKDLAVEMGLFVMSSTQSNAKADDGRKEIKNENMIRGARSIADKCDVGCFISRLSEEEKEIIEGLAKDFPHLPNQVMDIYKMRRGRFVNVRIWSYVDNGTCRVEDLFVTDINYNSIPDFNVVDFCFDYEQKGNLDEIFLTGNIEEIFNKEEKEVEPINNLVIEVTKETQSKKGLFRELL